MLDESLRGARAIVAAAPTPLEAVRGLIVERVAYTCEHQDLLKICFEEESELPATLAEPILERRRAFEAVVLEAVEAHLAASGRELPMAPKTFVNTCLGAANWVYKWYDPAGPARPRASWGSRWRRCCCRSLSRSFLGSPLVVDRPARHAVG